MALERSRRKRSKKKSRAQARRNIWLLVIMTILIIVSIFLFVPPNERISQGLDIRGGLSVVLTAKSDTGEAITDDDMEASRNIIENRVNALGATEATVQIQGSDQILVQIPGLSDAEEALNTIGKTGSLEFAPLDTFTDETVVSEIESGQYANQGTITDDFGNVFPAEEEEHLYVEPGTYTPVITGSNISSVSVGRASETSSYYSVNLTLDSEGAAAFAEVTEELAPTNGQIVIILDNEVQSAPAVQSEIPNGEVSITGNYTLTEAQNLETILESGSLPVSFEYSTAQVVGPTLGQSALYAGLIVALIGIIIVMIYLVFFYKGLGLITAASMVVFALLYLGILAGLSLAGQFSLTLAGIAGIVLTIGMAADSSVLTMERFREEIRLGRSVRAASMTGVRHAILTSIDADLVTLVSALCLFFLASASVKGFGLTLTLGIICDILMMVLFKAPVIRLMAPKTISHHPGFWGIKDSINAAHLYDKVAEAEGTTIAEAEAGEQISPLESEELMAMEEGPEKARRTQEIISNIKGRFIKRDINFLGHRKVFLIAACIYIVLCFVCVGVRGLNFGIEFVGGTSITFQGTGDITTEEMRAALDEVGQGEATIQTTYTDGQNGFLIRTTTTSAEDAASYATTVANELGLSTSSYEISTIAPEWGASVIQSSLIAFLVSIIIIIIYIAIRFEFKMGLMAVVALLHDLIIVMGIYALIGREFTPNTIAALLTILGYSLYDTVVVFHRINDNMKGENIRCTFMTMANHSINQVFIRTINTSLTSLIPVLALLIFGGEPLKDFALAMFIGLIAGSYSSIAIAAPLFSMWKSHEPRYKKLVRKYGTQVDRFVFDHAGAPALTSIPVSRRSAQEKAAKLSAQIVAEDVEDDKTIEIEDEEYKENLKEKPFETLSQPDYQAPPKQGSQPKSAPQQLSRNPRKNKNKRAEAKKRAQQQQNAQDDSTSEDVSGDDAGNGTDDE
ncbi:MAG: protein translocase subunit SecD [Eggerthellaceae bacterium]|nr:protein translocase subunit SecD [Eggerthellaceae bacterium]